MEGLQDISSDADKGRIMKNGFEIQVLWLKYKTISCVLFFILFHLSFFTFLFSLPSAYASEWKQAVSDRVWSFPNDHGNHPEYRTEWWYFTGNIRDEAGNRYGYQLTFFRQGIEHPSNKNIKLQKKDNPWSIRDVYLGHFALTDIEKKHFWYVDRTSRSGPKLAGADTEKMDVHILNWSARMDNRTIKINAKHQGMEINLALVPRKPVVFNGENGLSRKGPEKGQSSYYYSFTDLESKGTIKTPLNKHASNVKGISWFDHEFGSNQLSSKQLGWDWFSIHLSDGKDIMVYFIRKKDNSIEAASSGTLIEKNGFSRHLRLSDIVLDVLERWKSPKTNGVYPAKWRMRIPSAGIDINIIPSVANQELITESSTGVTYWEGAVEGKGLSGGKPVTIEGYVELTGYAGSLAGLF